MKLKKLLKVLKGCYCYKLFDRYDLLIESNDINELDRWELCKVLNCVPYDFGVTIKLEVPNL
jgi:hypothetical protein